jgi:cytoskeletal protein RodZ
MKILRFFPIIALVFLCLIAYGIYKTSSFINKKVNSETLLSQDSGIQNAVDSTILNVAQPLPAGLTDVSSIVTTPLPTTTASSATIVEEAPPKKETASIAPTSLETTVGASPKSVTTKTAATETASQSKVSQTKVVATKDVDKAAKSATAKATTSSSQTTLAKTETPKEASTTAKKENTDARFHVIIGTYASEANAKSKALVFEQKTKKKATILKYGGYYRVSADDFEFGQAAAQYALKLRDGGEDSIILKF